MKKTKSRKLELNRETVAPMNADQLADVNGGANSVSFSVSRGNSRGISVSSWSVGISVGESASVSISY